MYKSIGGHRGAPCERQNVVRRYVLPTVRTAIYLALCQALPLFAQAPARTPDTKPSAEDDVETVVITSGKRRQEQRAVAGTVSTVSGASLESRGAADAEEIFKVLPGVQVNKGGADSAIMSIRGINTNATAVAQNLTQTPTGVYVEDIPFTDPYGFITTADVAPFDLERVEVLRGPQGALYGSASLGGAIRYLYNKPNTKTTEFSALGTLSTLSGGGPGNAAYVMVNAPLSKDVAAARVVMFDRKESGFITNTGTGESKSNETHQSGGRILLGLNPSRDFSATIVAATQQTSQKDETKITPDPGKFEGTSAFAQPTKTGYDLFNLQLQYDVGSVRIFSNSGVTTKSQKKHVDLSRLYFPTAELFNDISGKSTFQEFRVSSKAASAFNWVLGVSFQRTTLDWQQDIQGFGASQLHLNIKAKAKEDALFGDMDYRIADKWTVGAGGRFFKTSLSNDNFNQMGPLFGSPPSTLVPYFSKESGFTPKLSVKYDITESASWYANTSRGFRFGGVSPGLFGDPDKPYKSDKLMNYETGIRYHPSKDLSLDVGAFYMDWKDIQLAALTTSPTGVLYSLVSNAGSAKNKGIEVSTRYAGIKNWTFDAALSLSDARLASQYLTQLSPGVNVLVPSGTRLPGTAKFQGSFGASYRFPGPMGSDARASALLTYNGTRNAQLGSPVKLDAYKTLDLRVAFTKGQWETTVFADNVTNSRGISSAMDWGVYKEYVPIRPRTVGVSLRYDM